MFVFLIICLTTYPINKVKINAENSFIPSEPGSYQVSWIDLIGVSDNSLNISIYYPGLEYGEGSQPNIDDGSYPTLLVSPGITLLIEYLRPLAEITCSWGYVVVLVQSRTGAYDLERTYDIISTLDWISEKNNDPSFILYQMIDEDHLGVMGHSMGGNAAILACVNETRFKVSVPIATGLNPWYTIKEDSAAKVHVPILFLYGSDDYWTKDYTPLKYMYANSPKFLVNISGHDHSSIIRDSITFKYIISFLNMYLSGEEEYSSQLFGEYAQEDVNSGLIRLTYDISVGKTEYEISNLVVDPVSVSVGESVTISVDVENVGTKSGTYPVRLMIDGDLVLAHHMHLYTEAKPVTVDVGASEKVSFTYQTDVEGIHRVEIEELEDSFEVVKPLIPEYEISNLVVDPVSVSVGESVTISVDVENVGTKSGAHKLTLMIDGDLIEEKTVTVDVGQSEKVTFTYQTDVEGSYQVEIGELSDSFEVVKPLIPEYEISNLVVDPVSVSVGESVTISVDVENVGTKSGMYTVNMTIDGDMVEEKTVTVDVGASEKVTFTYQTDVEGVHKVEIGELSDSFEVKKPIIPGFPAVALVLGLSLIMIFLTQRKQ